MSSSSVVVSSAVVYGSALTTIYTAPHSCFDLPSTFETSLCWSNEGVPTCTWSQPESCYPPGPGILSSTTTRGIPVHLTYGYSPGVLPYGFNTFEGANWGPGQTNEVWGCYVGWVGREANFCSRTVSWDKQLPSPSYSDVDVASSAFSTASITVVIIACIVATYPESALDLFTPASAPLLGITYASPLPIATKSTLHRTQTSRSPEASSNQPPGTSSDQSSTGISVAAKAGVGVGVGLGVLLLLLMVWLIVRRRRQQSRLAIDKPREQEDSEQPHLDAKAELSGDGTSKGFSGSELPNDERRELPVVERHQELISSPDPRELSVLERHQELSSNPDPRELVAD